MLQGSLFASMHLWSSISNASVTAFVINGVREEVAVTHLWVIRRGAITFKAEVFPTFLRSVHFLGVWRQIHRFSLRKLTFPFFPLFSSTEWNWFRAHQKEDQNQQKMIAFEETSRSADEQFRWLKYHLSISSNNKQYQAISSNNKLHVNNIH